jgi:hypothetical protein
VRTYGKAARLESVADAYVRVARCLYGGSDPPRYVIG